MMPISGLHVKLDQLDQEANTIIHAGGNIRVISSYVSFFLAVSSVHIAMPCSHLSVISTKAGEDA